jgi:serine/threonine protein phosphatase PrpC
MPNTAAAPATVDYVPTAAVSAALRRELATAFPGVKFRVRTRKGSSSLSVTWTDGPSTKDVDQACAPFQGSHWDSWNETYHHTSNAVTTTYRGVTYSGKPLVDGINTHQEVSDDARSEAARLWAEAHGGLQPEDATGLHGSFLAGGYIVRDGWAPNQVLEIAQEVVLPRRWATLRPAAAPTPTPVATDTESAAPAPADVDAPPADTAAYATAANVGTRPRQCDATAVADGPDGPDGVRAYVLLDGIGSGEEVAEWTQAAAEHLARTAAELGDAEAGLRTVYDEYAADPERQDRYAAQYMPKAGAVVAVHALGGPLSVAWSGDVRAYLLAGGIAQKLTDDHNLRRVYPPTATYPDGGNRNVLTSCLGSARTDAECINKSNHPAIEATTVPLAGGRQARLLLASDGAYEPHLEAGHDLFVELDDDPLASIARAFVDVAVKTSLRLTEADRPGDGYADNATILLADLPTT